MIPGTVASQTGPGMRFYEHSSLLNTAASRAAPVHPTMGGSGNIIFAGPDIGVCTVTGLSSSDISSKTTRHTKTEIEYSTSATNARPHFINSLYVYASDNVNTSGPKTSTTIGGTLSEVSLASSQPATYATHAAKWLIAGNASVAVSSDGSSWTVSTPTPSTFNSCRGLASSPTCVIAANNGGIHRTTDSTLTSWTRIGSASAFRDAYYANTPSGNYFVVVGSNGALYYSTDDGVSFTQKVTGFSVVDDIYCVMYCNGTWVITGSGYVHRSDTSNPSGGWRLVYDRVTSSSNTNDRVAFITGATSASANNLIVSTANTATGKFLVST